VGGGDQSRWKGKVEKEFREQTSVAMGKEDRGKVPGKQKKKRHFRVCRKDEIPGVTRKHSSGRGGKKKDRRKQEELRKKQTGVQTGISQESLKISKKQEVRPKQLKGGRPAKWLQEKGSHDPRIKEVDGMPAAWGRKGGPPE